MTSPPSKLELRYERVRTADDVTLEVATLGPADGAPVLLLHGFPESHRAWRHQMGALAAAGFRAVAPDLRGYGASDKPKGVSSYTLAKLSGDVAALARRYARGAERMVLVGHDWGGVVAIDAAARYPALFSRLVVLNAPHANGLLRVVRKSPAQLRRSWYVFAFQIPGLAEAIIKRPEFTEFAFKKLATRKEAWDPATLEEYTRVINEPGAATAMLSYYRAAMRDAIPGRARSGEGATNERVTVPTLVLWGKKDTALGPEVAESLRDFIADVRIEWAEGASHWVQHDEPDWVNERLVAFARG